MRCLGIESTAHTFSVGIVNSLGMVESVISDTYMPSEGGLKPGDVVEHHYSCYQRIIQDALVAAKCTLKDIDLIAFSQGPGLGPVLKIGAGVGRALALGLEIPLVGVNHCIAHVEIGRLLCEVEDPITLYVSGGNTLVSAFQEGVYQIFGETLDVPIGNMIDMVARLVDIPHPGGPRIEKLAAGGSKYLPLPYVVKGMDLSYSGFFTAVKHSLQNINKLSSNKSKTQSGKAKVVQDSRSTVQINDLMYSLQETAFSMLAEVLERALAHTKKKSVLLTGGVAANRRLQEMIAYVSQEHDAKFHVVPMKVAGDNGAMIAWTGILKFLAVGGDEILKTPIQPKWRMDDVEIPWRNLSLISSKDQKEILQNELTLITPKLLGEIPQFSTFSSIPSKISDNQLIKTICDWSFLQNRIHHVNVLNKGAEAIILDGFWISIPVVIKYRFPKQYRVNYIDQQIRRERTAAEARILLSLSKSLVSTPSVLGAFPSEGIIIMQKIPYPSLKDSINRLESQSLANLFYQIGQDIAIIHQNGIVHGDLTTSNILVSPAKVYFIDFGLAQNSEKMEDFALDLHLFKRVILSTHGEFFETYYPRFLRGYADTHPNAKIIIERIEKIELRGRYIAKERRRRDSIG